jgi:hypothetical protein
MAATMHHRVLQALSLSLVDNKPLLDFPSKATVSTGKLKGQMGDLGMFSSGQSVPVWKPSSSHSMDRYNEGGNETDITRVCTLRFQCPASLIHHLWFDKHGDRKNWDDRTCLDSEKQMSFTTGSDQVDSHIVDSPINIFWFLSQPKPMISPRDFLYAYREVSTPKKGERLYVGSSFETQESDNFNLEKKGKRSDVAVRAWLQGMCRVQDVDKGVCDVTYLVRVKPKGSLVKSVALLVANELVYTLFNLREKAEQMFRTTRAKKKKQKQKQKQLLTKSKL